MSCYISPAAFLTHWQGHRRLTRRTIEAFPADQLFGHTIGGMRSFGTLALEMVGMAAPMVRGLVNDDWSSYQPAVANSQAELLGLWDATTADIDRLWPTIPDARWSATLTAFGQYTGPGHELMLYVVDNEIHHRGQGYVYLRDLGIAPPPFYERD